MVKDEDIRTLINKIKSGIGEENASKVEDDFISLSTRINSLVSKTKEQESELRVAQGESKDRRLALNEYRKQSDEKSQSFEDQIKELRDNNNSEELTAEVERLRGFEKETIESQRSNLKSFVERVKDHERFSKVSSRFKLPTNDDGIDFEGFANIEHEDLKHNLAQMKDLEDIEYFDSTQQTNKNLPPTGGKAQRGTDKSFNEKMGSTRTHKEVINTLKEEGVIQ